MIVTAETASEVDFLLIGHFTADLTPEGRVVGGTVSYAIRTAWAFGLRVGLVTSSRPDDPLLDDLTPYGQLLVVPAEETTTFENIYEPEGRKQYIRGVAAPIRMTHIPHVWRRAPMVHVGPIAGEADDPAILALFSHATILVTLQGWLRKWGPDGLVRFKSWDRPVMLEHIDMLVFSEEDITEEPSLLHMLTQNAKHLFFTQAERGGLHFQYGVPNAWQTPQMTVVNPTGAGDVFASSLLCALHKTASLRQATMVAARLGAIAVTRFAIEGTPTKDEVAAAFEAARDA